MPFSTNTQSNSNGVVNMAVGQMTTSAATAAPATINLGFVPRSVKVINQTDRTIDEWFEGMAAASSLHTVAAGTVTLETVNGITVTGASFTLNAAALPASKSFTWVAFM